MRHRRARARARSRARSRRAVRRDRATVAPSHAARRRRGRARARVLSLARALPRRARPPPGRGGGRARRYVATIQPKPFNQPRIVTCFGQHGSWLRVFWDGRFGWLDRRGAHGWSVRPLEPNKVCAKHEEWPGDNAFFASGRVVIGADLTGFAFTNVISSLPTAVFASQTCAGHGGAATTLLRAATAALWVVVMSLLWRAAVADPGMLPRNPVHVPPTLPRNTEQDEPNPKARRDARAPRSLPLSPRARARANTHTSGEGGGGWRLSLIHI